MTNITISKNSEIQPNNDFSLESLVKEFLIQHDVRKSSRDRYKKSLDQFLKWFKDKNISQITRPSILEYKDMLFNEGKSSKTVSAYVVSIRLFFDYLNQEYNIKNIAKGIKIKTSNKFDRKALNETQASELLSHFEKIGNVRNYALIHLLLRTGMRTVECIRANIEDVSEIQGKRCLFVQGKGKDDRKAYVLLTDKLLYFIKAYIETRKDWKPTDPLFISESNNNMNQRLTTKTISTVARIGLDAIGLHSPDYTAHSLRHTAGSIMLSKGVDVDRVKDVLRHTSVTTTLGYVHSANEKKRIEESPESSLDDAF